MSKERTLDQLSVRELAEELAREIRHGEQIKSPEFKRISRDVALQLYQLIGAKLDNMDVPE